MAPEHAVALDVEGRGLEPLGHAGHVGWRHEQEQGIGIDEAADQPGAGDPVHLGPRPRDPDGAALRVARRQDGCRHHRQAGRRPARHAAFQGLGGNALMAQQGGDALAELLALLAGYDRRPALQLRRPSGEVGPRPADRGGDETRIQVEGLVRPNVDDRSDSRAFP